MPHRAAPPSPASPFCGPNTAEAPFSPHSGLSTSQAAVTLTRCQRASSPVRSRCASCARAARPPAAAGDPIQQLHAQRLHHPGAAVVSGAAANAENDRLHAALQRRQHQFAGAVTGGDARIALAGRRRAARKRRPFQSLRSRRRPAGHRTLYRLPSGPVTVTRRFCRRWPPPLTPPCLRRRPPSAASRSACG